MMNWLRKNMRIIFLITIIGFFAGIFIGFGGYFFGGMKTYNDIAMVNGVKIPKRKYQILMERILENLRNQNVEVTDDVLKRVKQEAIQDLIQEEVFFQESKKYGITVTDAELAFDIQNVPAFRQDNKFSQQAYFQILYYQLKMTPQEFEETQRRQIAIAKLKNLVYAGVIITEPELMVEYSKKNRGKMSKFEKEKDKFRKEIYEEKLTGFMGDWYRSINQSLKVKVFEENIG